MHKIIVIGCPGSGKTTLAKIVADTLSLPLVHLDSLFWKEGWEHISREEFDEKLSCELEKDRWIIDGNYSRTIKMRLDCADTVVFLDYPAYVCVWRVIKRLVSNYGKTRSDMGTDCPERFDYEFIKYVWNFNKTERKKLYEKLADVSGKQIIIIHNKKELENFLAKIGEEV